MTISTFFTSAINCAMNRLANHIRHIRLIAFVLIAIIFIYAIRHQAASSSLVKTSNNRSGILLARMSDEVSIKVADRGRPYLNLLDGREVITSYEGPDYLVQALEKKKARPTSLSSADFDEDGVPDLISGYANQAGGIITLMRGNVDSIYPNSAAAKQRTLQDQYTDAPFLSPARVYAVPEGPEFVGAGDFDGDSHQDVVLASRGDSRLYLMSGDGKGGLSAAKGISLPGKVTALLTGEINRRDGLEDVVVGVATDDGPKVLVYEGPAGALMNAPEAIELPVAATSLALGQLEGDQNIDLAVAAANQLIVIVGRDRKLSLDKGKRTGAPQATVHTQTFSFRINSIAIGDFEGKKVANIALLTDREGIVLLGEKSSKGSKGEKNRWATRTISSARTNIQGQALRARVSGLPADDLVVLDSTQQKLRVVVNPASNEGTVAAGVSVNRQTVSADVDSLPVAALALRLNKDAIDDLVILRSSQVAPAIVASAQAAIITVNSEQDANLRDNGLTLREAILISNGELTVNQLTADERAQVSGTPGTPGMDEIRFNIGASVAAAQPASKVETGDASAGYGAGFYGSSGEAGLAANPGRTSVAAQAGSDVWESIGPEGGTINVLAIDPTNANTIYAGTRGGVFKSANGGVSWSAANSGLTDREINALAIDPANTSTIYAGTTAPTAGGVFKSTNGGASWSAAYSGLNGLKITALAIDPTNTNIIYAGTTGTTAAGVFKSTNGGASWSAVNSGLTQPDIRALAIDPTNASTIYAGTLGGTFKSANGGASWSAANSGLTDLNVNALAIDPINTSTIYAGTLGGVFKSTNGGASWSATNSGLANLNINALAIDPINTNTVYTGATGVFKSTNGGASWSAANSGLAGVFTIALAIDPTNTNTLYAGTALNGGVFKSINRGANWSAANTGLIALYTLALAIDPTDTNTLYAGAYDGRVFKSTNGGAIWSAANSGLPDIYTLALAIDPINTNTVYAGTRGVFKSTNGGASWSAADTGLAGLDIYALAIDPANPSILYAGRNGGVFKSTNGGASWSAADSGLAGLFISGLVIDPTNTSIIYASTNGTAAEGVFKSTNGGANWSAINSGLPRLDIYTLAIDPINTNTLYAGTKGVFKSTNGGASWSATDSGFSDLFVGALAIDPTNPSTLYAGTYDGGVFKSTNRGRKWAAFGIGLGNTDVFSLAIHPSNSSQIFAGTEDSVFRIDSTGCTFTLNPSSASFPTNGGSGSLTVTTSSGCNWTAVRNADWLTITAGASGTGTGTVSYNVAANPGSNLRTGSLTVAGQVFIISQFGTGSDCLLTPISSGQTINGSLTTSDCLSPFRARLADRYSFNASAGQKVRISLTSSAFDTYLYLVGPDESIIAQDDDGAGNGNSRIPSVTGFFSIPAAGRYVIEVTSSFGNNTGDYTLSLTQRGTGEDCSFSINPNSQSFAASGGSGSVSVTTAAGCAWTAKSNDSFITITSGVGGNGDGTVNYSIAANNSGNPRTGTMTIAGQNFTVTQSTACSFSINPTTATFNVSGGTANVAVTAPNGCAWTAKSNDGFITITSGASGNGNGQVSYRVSANAGAATRSGTITIAGLTFTLTQEANRNIEVRTINLSSPLPKITDPVIIDGATQPNVVIELNASGARGADVLTVTAGSSVVRGLVINRFNASNVRASGILLITGGGNVIEGCLIGANATGTKAAEPPVGREALSSGISVRGSSNNRIGGTTANARNLISGNDGNGITISNGATNNRVQGNYTGPDVTGSISLGNQRIGIYIVESSNNFIGDTSPGAGNLISGNIDWGIYVADGSSNTIQGNQIGTDAAGSNALPNGNAGVGVTDTTGSNSTLTSRKVTAAATTNNNSIGGTSAAARNIISGNDPYGIVLTGGVNGTQVQGNYIGTDVTGTKSLGNGYGIIMTQTTETSVGGAAESARNIISGNKLTGISIGFLVNGKVGGTGSTIQGNDIGVLPGGAPLGNGQDGIFVEVNSLIHTIKDNRIAFNGGNGVRIPNVTANSGAPAVRITLQPNLFYSNGALGIDLGDAGVTQNDEGDTDGGANEQLNFPDIQSAASSTKILPDGEVLAAAQMTVSGTYSGKPNENITLQFYFGLNCTGGGNQFIGSIPVLVKVITDKTRSDGRFAYEFVFDIPDGRSGGYVNATATDAVGNTSEFSQCAVVGIPAAIPTITSATVSGKKLLVNGSSFDSGANILIGDAPQKTNYESAARLIGKKAGKKIKPGDKIKVRNSDGTTSNEWTYQP